MTEPPKPSEKTEAEGNYGPRGLRHKTRYDPIHRRRVRRRDNGLGNDNDSDFESDFESDIEGDFYDDSELDFDTSETDEEICEGKQAQIRMLNNVDVYALAEKYNLPGLKELAAKKFRRDACKCPLNGLAAIAHETYTSTPSSDRGIRDLVIQICETHLDQIMEARDLEAVMEEIEGFGSDMFKVVRGKYKKQLEVNEDLRSKVRAKKQKVGKLIKKKRDLREQLNAKDEIIKYAKTQHENLDNAYSFASWQVHDMFNKLPFRLKKDLKCERCKDYSPEPLQWADSGEPPYLQITCDDCNWRNEQEWARDEKKKAFSLEELDYEWKWRERVRQSSRENISHTYLAETLDGW